ncbi:MAG: hypothetical protein ACLU37_10600 [Collinsella sp.]
MDYSHCFSIGVPVFRLKNPEYSKWNLIALLIPAVLLLVFILYKFGLFNFVASRFGELETDVSYSQRSGAIAYIIHSF